MRRLGAFDAAGVDDSNLVVVAARRTHRHGIDVAVGRGRPGRVEEPAGSGRSVAAIDVVAAATRGQSRDVKNRVVAVLIDPELVADARR